MKLRAATEADLPAIFEIYDEQVLHGTATFDTVPKTEAERFEWLHLNPGGRYPIVVAEDGAGVAGWGRLYPWSPRPAYERSAENAVYVRATARRRGIGRALLAELLRLAPEAGVLTLVARIVDGNPASLALHEALGYERIGLMRRCGVKHGQVLDVWLLQRVLDAPA
ncbi:GNAT family N-acetyltransferase [Solimonas variicoloris]|uniref:GNAT family N-acetyltransferase n=1 Tax=Solimonas variicoloris TaxID=254408 RepID=UPI00037786CB|nr:GNAT family N-acetyltransferase [Solimonas variicoloris]